MQQYAWLDSIVTKLGADIIDTVIEWCRGHYAALWSHQSRRIHIVQCRLCREYLEHHATLGVAPDLPSPHTTQYV